MTDKGISEIIFEEKKFTWEIQNYSRCTLVTGSALRSPSFSVGPNGYSTWHLLLFPYGEKTENSQFVSFKIVLEKCNHLPLKVSVELEIERHASSYSAGTGIRKFDFKEIRGSSCLPLTLYNETSKYSKLDYFLKNNVLTIYCTLSIPVDVINTPPSSSTDIELKNFDLDTLSSNYQTLWESETSSDFTIFVDKESFPVHKIILAARSPVFAALMSHDMKEKNENSVMIQEVKSDVVKEMLRYIYTGKVENLEIVAGELFELAKKYQLKELEKICIGTMSKHLDVDNAVNLLILSELHQIENLKKHILDFIANHSKLLLQNEKFKPLLDSPIYHSLYNDIMCAVSGKTNFVTITK